MGTTWIRVAYAIVLALVLFFTVQFGITMAMKGPTPPGDPGITFRQLTAGDSDSSQNQLTASIDQYYGDAKDYRDDYVGYQRNIFLAGAGLAALLALIGVLLPAAVNYLRLGLLLGAGLALVWAGYIASSSVPSPAPPVNSVLALVAAGEPEPLEFAGRFLRFAVSFVGLILLLFIGLWRLTEWPSSPRKRVVATSAPAQPAPVTSTWAPAAAPPPAPPAEPPPAVGNTTVVAEPAPPRTDAPPEAVRWQRPADASEPAPRPDGAP